MATFLLAWELGGGLGHLANLRPIAEGLAARGHRVAVALRDLSRARQFFASHELVYYQAPFKHRRTKHISPTVTFAHLLHNIGFSSADELGGLAEAWRNLIQDVGPQVFVCDHAPTALLAARGLPVQRVLIGTGFFCPLDASPFPRLRNSEVPDPACLAHDERALLHIINEVLAGWGETQLDRVADLYYPHSEHLLVTLPELDHYSGRENATYWGCWPNVNGKLPSWPDAPGKRVFAYLKPFKQLPHLLNCLRKIGGPTIIYCDGVPAELQRDFHSAALRFENEPLNMNWVGRDCDLAVLNANHGTAASLLLQGKPALQIPLYLEQSLLAAQLRRLGVCEIASPDDAGSITKGLELLWNRLDAYSRAACAFADKYAGYCAERQLERALDRLEKLAGEQAKSCTSPHPTQSSVETFLQRARDHESIGDVIGAIEVLRRALRASPACVDAHYRLALCLQRQKNHEAAIASFEAAIRLRPDANDVRNDLGCSLWALNRLDEAAKAFQRVLGDQPQSATVLNNLGCVLRAMGKHREAITAYREGISICPTLADLHNNLGCALRADQQLSEARLSYETAVNLQPDFADAWSNLGTLQLEMDCTEEAIESQKRATGYSPKSYKILHNLATAYSTDGQFRNAIDCYDRALSLCPQMPEMEFNRGVAYLTLGEFEQGWDGFEFRLQSHKHRQPRLPQPKWDGSSLAGKSILLLAEQGLGDTLQFIRYVALVAERAREVRVAVPPALIPLFRASRIPGVVEHTSTDTDWHASLLSLPKLLGTKLSNLPADVPYLSADASLCEQWKARLTSLDGFKVGIHWQGSRDYEGDRWRSIPLRHFGPLAQVAGVRLVSLQKNDGVEQLSELAEQIPVSVMSAELDESAGAFMDTAAIIKNLDLVITSDSAVAHLAGALGAPVWLCLPKRSDWRWLLDRADSPWYPTMRLFRQRESGNWGELFERMAHALLEVVGKGGVSVRGVIREETAVSQPESNGKRSERDARSAYREGLRLAARGNFATAIVQYQRSIILQPDFAPAFNDLGCALANFGQHADAEAQFRRAIELRPDFADAFNNLGCSLRAQGKSELAQEPLRRAIALRPGFAEAMNNLGNVLHDLGRLDEAESTHRAVLELQPSNPEAFNSLGSVLSRRGCLDEALTCFDATLATIPTHVEARLSRSLIWLAREDLRNGLAEYEVRHQSKRYRARGLAQPVWEGQLLNGQSLLVHSEQGLGDTIQFIRFVRHLDRFNGTVWCEVQPALVPLLQQSRFVKLIARGDTLPKVDFQIPMMSVPRLLGTTIDELGAAVPYLLPADALVEKWSRRLATLTGYRVGIAWQGSRTYKEDAKRSIPVRSFELLTTIPNVQLISLQKGFGSEQLAQFDGPIENLDGELDEDGGAFCDTAAVMKSLDLVITSDTSIAHLAGALSVPVWLCLPHVADWRWFLDRQDSPWYPTMRLFRQRRSGDWCGVFEQVAHALRHRILDASIAKASPRA